MRSVLDTASFAFGLIGLALLTMPVPAHAIGVNVGAGSAADINTGPVGASSRINSRVDTNGVLGQTRGTANGLLGGVNGTVHSATHADINDDAVINARTNAELRNEANVMRSDKRHIITRMDRDNDGVDDRAELEAGTELKTRLDDTSRIGARASGSTGVTVRNAGGSPALNTDTSTELLGR